MPLGRTPPDHDQRWVPHGSRSDMLRETCPEDFQPIEVEPAAGLPSAWVLFGPPIGICLGVVLVAALHTALGSPLGPEWGMEVWGLAKMAILPTLTATTFGYFATRHNRVALQHLDGGRVSRAEVSGGSYPATRRTGPHPTVRQTGPHRVLGPGRQPLLELDEEEEAD